MRAFVFIISLLLGSNAMAEAWKHLGPWGGQVTQGNWDASEDGSVIAIGKGEQVFVSLNQGVTWHTEYVDLPINDSIGRLRVVKVAGVDVLVANTWAGNEILVSDDLGKQWKRIRIPELCMRKVAGFPPLLARGGQVLNLIAMSDYGACSTTNMGVDWRIIEADEYHGHPALLHANPGQPGMIYSNHNGFHVYGNNGQRWLASHYIRDFAVDPFNPARVLGLEANVYVRQSLDYGLDFEPLSQIEEPEAFYHSNGIAFDPAIKDRVYIYGSSAEYLHVSNDGGKTWTLQPLAGNTAEIGQINEIRSISSASNKVLVATQIAGFGLLDLDTWRIHPLNHGFSTVTVTALDHYDQGTLEMFAGTMRGEIYQYNTDSVTWSRQHGYQVMSIEDVVIDWNGTGNVLVAGSATLFWRDPADGQWHVQARGVWPDPHNYSSSYQADPNVPGRYLGSVDNLIFESLDYGATGEVIIEAPSSVGDIFFFDSDPERILVTGVGGAGLSHDGGATWETHVPSINRYRGGYQGRMDERRLWIPAYDGYLESRDAGENWVARLEVDEAAKAEFETAERGANGQSSMAIYRIFTAPGDDDHLFLLGSRVGYAESRDNGLTWDFGMHHHDIYNYSMKANGVRPEDAYLGSTAGVLSLEAVVPLSLTMTERRETETGLKLVLEVRNTGSSNARDVRVLWNVFADDALEQRNDCEDAGMVDGLNACRFGDIGAGEARLLNLTLNAGTDHNIVFHSGVISRDAISDNTAASVSTMRFLPEPEVVPESEPEPEPNMESEGKSGGGLLHPIVILLLLIGLSGLWSDRGRSRVRS